MAGVHEREPSAAAGHEAASEIDAPGAVDRTIAPKSPSAVLALQRAAGNQAVAGMLSQAALQRAPARTSQTANIAKLNTLKGNADARFRLTSDIAVKARDAATRRAPNCPRSATSTARASPSSATFST
ncbi:MAG TPA: hypothetical protein VK307_01840, partial [Thermoleophilaceae bacterium]|nr:hypothetical protein [Thermoleophilaceae bacterium]